MQEFQELMKDPNFIREQNYIVSSIDGSLRASLSYLRASYNQQEEEPPVKNKK